jgi:hypothetical protein
MLASADWPGRLATGGCEHASACRILFIERHGISFERAAELRQQPASAHSRKERGPMPTALKGERPPRVTSDVNSRPAWEQCGSADSDIPAKEEHGFIVDAVDGLDVAREAGLARISAGSSVMTDTSVTPAETGMADAINDDGPHWSAAARCSRWTSRQHAQEMKAIGGQPDYALGCVHAIDRDGHSSSPRPPAASSPPTPRATASVVFVVGAQSSRPP